jgi:centromeric protein E
MYSGKTYTVSGTAHDPGIVPIAVNELFHLITERRSTEAFKVSLGYLEIYNERIYDLCSPSLNGQDGKDSGGKSSSSGKDNSKDSGRLSKELPLYEDARLGTCVRGLTSQTVTSPEQVLHALAVAQSSRSMAATAMNLNSSRSHTITRLVVEASAVRRKIFALNTT